MLTLHGCVKNRKTRSYSPCTITKTNNFTGSDKVQRRRLWRCNNWLTFEFHLLLRLGQKYEEHRCWFPENESKMRAKNLHRFFLAPLYREKEGNVPQTGNCLFTLNYKSLTSLLNKHFECTQTLIVPANTVISSTRRAGFSGV